MERHYFQSISVLGLLLLGLSLGCGGSEEATGGGKADASQQPEVPKDATATPGTPQSASAEDNPRPRVVFKTSAGDFTVVLHRDKVERTVDNFLSYVDSQFYNGTVFHNVITGYAVEGGGYTLGGDNNRELIEKPGGVSLLNEAANGLSNLRGTIGMARKPDIVDSARSQFYINLVDNPSLDHAPEEAGVPIAETAGYCAFGTVEEGMEVLDAIGQTKVDRQGELFVPSEPVVIYSAERL